MKNGEDIFCDGCGAHLNGKKHISEGELYFCDLTCRKYYKKNIEGSQMK